MFTFRMLSLHWVERWPRKCFTRTTGMQDIGTLGRFRYRLAFLDSLRTTTIRILLKDKILYFS